MANDEPLLRLELETAGIHVDTPAELQRRFSGIGVETDERHVVQFSVEPPAWLEVIASVATWKTLLGGAATLYFGGLFKAAGEETWKNRKELARAVTRQAGRGIQRIRQFVRAVDAVTLDRSQDIDVYIVGDNMRFRLSLGDEDEAIDTVARSVYLMQRIRKTVDEIGNRINEEDRLLGKVDVIVQQDGFTVQWTSPEPWTRHARDYDMDGKPKGEAYTPGRQ